ncbi:MAG TPA: MFS transporter [Actinomycetota bacterium]|nr:MFS transporter [Actinomycetota bacterium]
MAGVAGADVTRLVRRATLLLVGAQVALWAVGGAFAAFGPLSIQSLSGREGSAPLLFSLYSLAAAAGAVLAGRLMDRLGRRPGLLGGYVLMAAAGLLAFVAVRGGRPGLMFASGAVLGMGAAAALLGRAAVADMYAPERRGRAVGLLVGAGTVGAVGGPLLAGAVHALAERLGMARPLAAPWLLLAGLALIGAGLVAAIRPDPRELAADGPRSGEPSRRLSELFRLRPAATAVVSIGVAHAVMVTFMAQLPPTIHQHGAGELTVSVVVSIHLAGMFAFSPVFGAVIDRWGRRMGLFLGAVLSASGVALGMASTATVPVGAGLLLIGMGWSAAYLGSTAVVSDLAAPHERARALGVTDLVAALSAGGGTLGGALLIGSAGLGALGVAGLALLALPIALLVPLREPAPGRWVTEAGRTANPPV